MNKNERIILFLLACINFTHILDFMILMPLGNYLMPFFNISTQQFSFLVGAYTFSAAISGFTAAFFVDGFDRKKVLLFAYMGFLLGTLACGLAPTFHLLLAARILAGLFGGLIGAQVLSIISDIFTYERRGKAMGAVMSAFAISSTFGVPFSLYLANIFSWHAPFLFVAVVGIVLIPLMQKYIPSIDQHLVNRKKKESPFEAIHIIKQDKNLMLALLFSGLIMLGHFLIIPFINPYMEFNNGFSKQLTPMIYLVGGLASFIAANLLGRLADKYGKLKIFSICIFISLPLVIGVTHVPAIPFWIILVMFAFWFTVATGRGVTAQAMISNTIKAEHRGSFMSFNSSVQQLGTSFASVLAGIIVIKANDGKLHRYNWLGYISVLVLLGCLFLGRYIFKEEKSSSVQTDENIPELI
jgi:DHA1 family inner membrane transport protein